MNILDERQLEPAERAAIADEPRPGVWIEEHDGPADLHGDVIVQRSGDGRTLTQNETDNAIVAELRVRFDGSRAGFDALVEATRAWDHRGGEWRAQQRGGIHSDPLVRLLAFRAWGDRDRQWRKRDTARAIAGGDIASSIDRVRRFYGFTGIAVYLDDAGHCTAYQAHRDDRVATAKVAHDVARERDRGDLLLDVFDELDAKLAAGGEPIASGPCAFDVTALAR